MKLDIELFGGLRELAPRGRIELTSDTPLTVSALKTHVAARLRAGDDTARLIEAAALANEERVLDPGELLALRAGSDTLKLALLPPVNGG